MKIIKLAVLSVLGLAIVSCDGKKASSSSNEVLNSKLDSVSYALGLTSSQQAKSVKEGLKKEFGLTLNQPAYLLGFDNGVDSTGFKVGVDKSRVLLTKFIGEQRELAKKRKETNAAPTDLPISSDASLKTVMDSVSYALGVKNGGQMIFMKNNVKNGLDLDLNMSAFKNGYTNGAEGDSTKIKISETDSKNLLDTFFKETQEKVNAKNKKEGEEFLIANKTKDGVKTTASGLQYTVIKEGNGKSPEATSAVKVHYHGTLINGKVFDSSVDRGQPAEFPLNGVIKGWTEGLQLMKEGAKYRFYIPQELAYGQSTASPLIKPFSTLIFDVELLEVK